MKSILRNLAYMSVIVASITVTIHHLTTPAQATGANFIIAGGPDNFYVSADLMIRQLSRSPAGWVGAEPLPARPAFLGSGTFVDTDGNGWVNVGGANPWVLVGPPPGEKPIQVEPSSWSQVKAKDWKPGN